MSYFILEDFRLGQDSRKSPLTAAPGTLTTLVNGHITRGGDLEVRKSFVGTYDLPAGTFGLAAAGGSLYAFGSVTDPGVPTGVTYQRLQHPDGLAMTGIVNTEIFGGLLYVIAEYTGGSIEHFYDGVLVDDFADGVARGSFTVTGGAANSAAAIGTFVVTGGTSNPGTNKVTSIKVNGIDILGASVDWATSHSNTAATVAAQINTFVSVPNYTAAAVGAVVTITASDIGTGPNGYVVGYTVGGDVTIGGLVDMAGGVDVDKLTSVTVNGVEVMSTAVSWAASNSATATAIASQITSYTSTPNYSAVASGTRVIISAATVGMDSNGFVVSTTTAGAFAISDIVNLKNGVDASFVITPGEVSLTFGTKEYTISGDRLVYSAVADPTDYNDVSGIGAGSTQLSNYSSGSEDLTGLEVFYDKVAIFAEEAIQLWNLAADDTNNAQVQVIQNTGTTSGRSTSPFGDGDVFYLANNGIRALKRALYSTAATVAEVGSAIDTTVIEYLATLTDEQVRRAVAVIEPLDKRYWLAVGDKIFVYSYFSGASISAWSTYEPGFAVSDFTVLNKRVYARSGDTIYLYGGTSNSTYDADTVCEFLVPYMDAKTPGSVKTLTGIDMVSTGTWDVKMAVNPDKPDDFDDIGIYIGSTLHKEKNPAQGQSTYFAFKFTHQKAEAARFSKFIMYFVPDDPKSASS